MAYHQAGSDIEVDLLHTFGARGDCGLSEDGSEIFTEFYKISLNKTDLVLQPLRERTVKQIIII